MASHPRGPAVLHALAALALSACVDAPYPEVKLDLTAPKGVSVTARPQRPSGPALRFSVAAMQSPADTFSSYSRFFTRMGALLDVPVELIQRRTYAEVNDLLLAGQLDAALVCTGGYLALRERAPRAVEVLAVPVIDGKTTYQSLVIVPSASRVRTMAALAGARFAYTDELSLSGHLYVAQALSDLGRDPQRFFGSATFTRSHDRSVEAVAKGLVDGAAVDSVVFEALVARDPTLRSRVRVVHRSPPFGVMPVVASPGMAPETRARLRAVLLDLHRDPEAAEALRAVHIERFVLPATDLYDGADRVERRAR